MDMQNAQNQCAQTDFIRCTPSPSLLLTSRETNREGKFEQRKKEMRVKSVFFLYILQAFTKVILMAAVGGLAQREEK